MKAQKLDITFHNPNTPESLSDLLIEIAAQVAKEKVQRELLLLAPVGAEKELA